MRQLFFIVLSVLVSAFFLYFVLRDVPLAQVMEQLQQANLFWFLIALSTYFFALWVRAWRWRDLLGYKIGQRDAFYIIGITFLLNLLPFRAGEVARSVLARRHDVPMVTAATSIVIERLLDTVLVVLLLALALANVPTVPPEVNQTAAIFGAAATGAVVVMLGFAHAPHIAHRVVGWLVRVVPLLDRLPLVSMLDNVLIGLQPLTQWGKLLSAIGLTLFSWVFSFLALYCLHLALHINDVDLILSTVLGVSMASFSVAIPISVAAIGPFQAAILIAGQMVSMANIQAVALGLLFHGASIISYLLWGVVGFLAMGLTLADLRGRKA